MVNLLVLALMIGLDLFTKHLAFSSLMGGSKLVLAPMISFSLAKNYGLGFGLGQEFTQLILWGNVIILLIFSYLFYKSKGHNEHIWLLILAGGLGNCWDRYFLGFVRDFILLSWGTWSWPIFNLADIYISIAFFLLMFPKKSQPHSA
jgi:signal peptidase II